MQTLKDELNVMGIQRFSNNRVRGVPFWVIGICGVAGVLVDIDHLISYWNKGYFTQTGHIPLAIISCLVLCGVGACVGGLYLKLVLKRLKKRRTS